MSTFYPRNIPYIKGDDPRYAEALEDIINKINQLAQAQVALEARIAKLEG